MWLPPLASRAENVSSISFNRGLTVHDRLTEHLGKRQWIHPKNFSCCSGIGATWASFILRAVALCCTVRDPHELTQGLAVHLFPLLGFPVWLQGPEDLNICHPDLTESQAALPCIHLALPANLRTQSCFTSLQLWQDRSHLTGWRMKAGS